MEQKKRIDIVLNIPSSSSSSSSEEEEEEDNPNKKVASKTAHSDYKSPINPNVTSKLNSKRRGNDYRYKPWPTPTQMGDDEFYPDFYSKSSESSSSSSESREGRQITTPCPNCRTTTPR